MGPTASKLGHIHNPIWKCLDVFCQYPRVCLWRGLSVSALQPSRCTQLCSLVFVSRLAEICVMLQRSEIRQNADCAECPVRQPAVAVTAGRPVLPGNPAQQSFPLPGCLLPTGGFPSQADVSISELCHHVITVSQRPRCIVTPSHTPYCIMSHCHSIVTLGS